MDFVGFKNLTRRHIYRFIMVCRRHGILRRILKVHSLSKVEILLLSLGHIETLIKQYRYGYRFSECEQVWEDQEFEISNWMSCRSMDKDSGSWVWNQSANPENLDLSLLRGANDQSKLFDILCIELDNVTFSTEFTLFVVNHFTDTLSYPVACYLLMNSYIQRVQL